MLPENGIYFAFRRGETVSLDGGSADRIVRVGTHRADGGLRRRVRYHVAGSRRTSIFRRHLGAALLARGNSLDPRLASWLAADTPRWADIEQAINELMRTEFSFARIPVDAADERRSLERDLIALLAQHPLALPSGALPGRHAARPAIRESGLWNTPGVGASPLSPSLFRRLVTHAKALHASPERPPAARLP